MPKLIKLTSEKAPIYVRSADVVTIYPVLARSRKEGQEEATEIGSCVVLASGASIPAAEAAEVVARLVEEAEADIETR